MMMDSKMSTMLKREKILSLSTALDWRITFNSIGMSLGLYSGARSLPLLKFWFIGALEVSKLLATNNMFKEIMQRYLLVTWDSQELIVLRISSIGILKMLQQIFGFNAKVPLKLVMLLAVLDRKKTTSTQCAMLMKLRLELTSLDLMTWRISTIKPSMTLLCLNVKASRLAMLKFQMKSLAFPRKTKDLTCSCMPK